MDQPERHPGDLLEDFEDAFGRLRALIAGSPRAGDPWPVSVARAIVAILDFAAEDPAGAGLLTTGALSCGAYGTYLHRKAVEYLAASLAACSGGGRQQGLPELVEEALVGGISEIVSSYLRSDRQAELPGLARQVIELTLLPYLGLEEARRIALAVAPGV